MRGCAKDSHRVAPSICIKLSQIGCLSCPWPYADDSPANFGHAANTKARIPTGGEATKEAL
jgi:hypothetical protein